MCMLINIVGRVVADGGTSAFVTRSNTGAFGMYTPVELLDVSRYRPSNYIIRQKKGGISVRCNFCKIEDLPVFNADGSISSKPKITILYAIVSSKARVGFCIMTAQGVVERRKYNEVVEMIKQRGSTNAYLRKHKDVYAVCPKYTSFKERSI